MINLQIQKLEVVSYFMVASIKIFREIFVLTDDSNKNQVGEVVALLSNLIYQKNKNLIQRVSENNESLARALKE